MHNSTANAQSAWASALGGGNQHRSEACVRKTPTRTKTRNKRVEKPSYMEASGGQRDTPTDDDRKSASLARPKRVRRVSGYGRGSVGGSSQGPLKQALQKCGQGPPSASRGPPGSNTNHTQALCDHIHRLGRIFAGPRRWIWIVFPAPGAPKPY